MVLRARGAPLLLALRMLFKRCYRISTVLASSFGREKTMQIRYVLIPPFGKRGENLRFQKYPDSWRQGLSDKQKKFQSTSLQKERFGSGFIKMLGFYRTVSTILQQLYFQQVECHLQGESTYRHSKSFRTIRRKNSYP